MDENPPSIKTQERRITDSIVAGLRQWDEDVVHGKPVLHIEGNPSCECGQASESTDQSDGSHDLTASSLENWIKWNSPDAELQLGDGKKYRAGAILDHLRANDKIGRQYRSDLLRIMKQQMKPQTPEQKEEGRKILIERMTVLREVVEQFKPSIKKVDKTH